MAKTELANSLMRYFLIGLGVSGELCVVFIACLSTVGPDSRWTLAFAIAVVMACFFLLVALIVSMDRLSRDGACLCFRQVAGLAMEHQVSPERVFQGAYPNGNETRRKQP